ncbi:F0F1 ATP synthase subunit delta [Salicibibacter halophilus]|uniref:ATP synthase subunit delta n=1 Tax=Salicibibacter halophilus TaxID=2502791 RepID=A0A514LJR7_9BACI|nr:F0F1 ATP synthase subunit delta [Salicibibacter halophilus]QDI91765.1 F0F1 ATP synthase subunit delta [Salicibibacter halophilus]
MSAPAAVANRYAKALFELANEKGVIEQVNEELHGVQTVFHSVPDLQQVMAHPKMSAGDQKALLEKGFSDSHPLVMNMLLVLVDRGRIHILDSLVHAFQNLSDDAFQIARADVRAIRPLSDQEKEEVARQFAKKVNNRQVVVTDKQDKDLIGGLVVQIGDTVYDGSVRGMLRRMERKIVSNR